MIFPERLYSMLEQCSLNSDDAKIVSWMPHGRAFRVHKKKDFVSTIMTSQFRQTKWPSFQRQLHLYGFRRITQGVDKGAYYHESFLRGQRELTKHMKFSRVKGTKVRKAEIPNRHLEPNFYQMPLLLSSTTSSTITPMDKTSSEIVLCTSKPLTSVANTMNAAKTKCKSSRISLSNRCSLLTGDLLAIPDNINELEDLFSDDEETPSKNEHDTQDAVPRDDDAWLRRSLLTVENAALAEAMQKATSAAIAQEGNSNSNDYKRNSFLPQDANEWSSIIEELMESQDASSLPSDNKRVSFLTAIMSL